MNYVAGYIDCNTIEGGVASIKEVQASLILTKPRVPIGKRAWAPGRLCGTGDNKACILIC